MKKTLTITIILLLIFGCGVHKRETHEKKEIKAVEVSAITDSVKAKKVAHVELSKVDKTTKKDKGTEVIKEVHYSKPDSVGFQYKIIEKIIEKRNDVVVSNDISEELIQDLELEIYELKRKNSKLETEINEKKDTKSKTKTTTPIWLYVLCFILGGVVFYVIQKQFKKFNIINKIIKLWNKVKSYKLMA